MQHLGHIIEDTFLEFLRLLPFLFITYLVLEYIEHKTEEKMTGMMRHSGPWGPILGSALGIIPQCGFSVSVSNLYSQRLVSVGTLLAVFLSTSDEMLPILISESVSAPVIIKILAVKFAIALAAGILVDIIKPIKYASNEVNIHETMCQPDGCNCDDEHGGILLPALHHTLHISVYILIISFALNFIVHTIGDDTLAGLILNKPIIGPVISAVVGFIPTCASSIVITQLYLEGAMSAGAMMSGLLSASGMGVLVLLRLNRRKMKDNLMIILLLFAFSIGAGILLDFIGISFI